jgi:methionine-S-sulfoxide reductase
MPGVVHTRVGYAGGTTDNPTYYSIGDHSETIQIDYDPDLITYSELLDVFWSSHNPSTRSFSRQYGSIIFFHNEQQQRLALDTEEREEAGKSVYTEIVPFSKFFLAEDYHQKYYLRQVTELMGELRGRYPLKEDFTNSTVTARLNGYIGGFGTEDQLEQELESFALSDQAKKYLRERVSRR